MSKVLIIDDGIEFSELLSDLLKLEGFNVDLTHDGKKALNNLHSSYDIVLLFIKMPTLNGIEIIKKLRRVSNIPIIILTTKDIDIDRTVCLELGADDYISMPFKSRELVASINAILRRVTEASEIENNSNKIKFSGLVVDATHQQVFFENKELLLTSTEFILLSLFIKDKGQILSREYLSLKLFNKPLTPFDRAIDMHISNLRKKLPPRNIPWFKTFRGKGYLFIG